MSEAAKESQSDQTELVLWTKGLAKTYKLGFVHKKVCAVTDVNLNVSRGQIYGLLGPNGAGKTTTLKVVLGLVRPTAGQAKLLGEPVGNLAAKRRLGYLPESPYFYDYLTGRELLTFVGQLFDLPRAECRRRADALLEKVGIAHAADLALRRYSKGMLQRVGLAQALINDPELVILDEPLSGLDPLGRKQLRELIAELRDRGKTVVFSSHILSDVELLADRVAILVKGRTVDEGPLHELLDARILSNDVVFGGLTDALRQALEGQGYRIGLQEGDTAQVTLAEAQPIDPVVDLVRKHEGQLLAITPRKQSLEDLIVSEVESNE